MRELAAAARRVIEETGSNVLYLAFGFLEWMDKESGKGVRAPFILLPVSLERIRVAWGDSVRYRYVLTASEEDLKDNLCLAEKLKRDFGLVLPSLWDDGDEARLAALSRCHRGLAPPSWEISPVVGEGPARRAAR